MGILRTESQFLLKLKVWYSTSAYFAPCYGNLGRCKNGIRELNLDKVEFVSNNAPLIYVRPFEFGDNDLYWIDLFNELDISYSFRICVASFVKFKTSFKDHCWYKIHRHLTGLNRYKKWFPLFTFTDWGHILCSLSLSSHLSSFSVFQFELRLVYFSLRFIRFWIFLLWDILSFFSQEILAQLLKRCVRMRDMTVECLIENLPPSLFCWNLILDIEEEMWTDLTATELPMFLRKSRFFLRLLYILVNGRWSQSFSFLRDTIKSYFVAVSSRTVSNSL